MEKIKVNHYLRSKPYTIRLAPTRWQLFKFRVKQLFRFTLKITIIIVALYTAGFIGARFFPAMIYAEKVVPVEVEAEAPVLDRIAMCESHNSHYCTEDLIKLGMCAKTEKGQVLVSTNKNVNVDVGRYQINVTYWGAKASELGLNLFTESDNEKMAKWIYANKGTGDWSASSKCWSR